MMRNLLLTLLLLTASSCAFATNYVCGQDLNGNGEIDDASEYKSCIAKNVIKYTEPNMYCLPGFVINGLVCEKVTNQAATPICPYGTYDPSIGMCRVKTSQQADGRCITYISGQTGGLGVNEPAYDHYFMDNRYAIQMTDNGQTCRILVKKQAGVYLETKRAPTTYTCPGGGQLSGNQCIFEGSPIPPTMTCPPGFTYQGAPFNFCHKLETSNIIYSCPAGTALNGATPPKCTNTALEYYCPIGADSNCLNNNGGSSCSPNKCIDLDTSPPIEEGNIDGSMLVNDGKKNEDGLCLDQMFIFNGRAQDCKMPGASNAFKDCCKSEGKALSDDAGSLMSMSQTMSTVSHIYSAATEAYTAYNAAIQAGQTAAAAMNSGVAAAQNYMMVAFDPTSLAISVAVYVVMKYLATACDQLSMETALMNDSGYCHKVGTYCKKKIKFIGCVQKAQSHCCFNSKLARIIHEQGRPQLKTGINNWGSPEAPLCRGFTPEEFQAVDFGKIDLTEYIDEIQKNATDEIQKSMGNITSDFIDQTH